MKEYYPLLITLEAVIYLELHSSSTEFKVSVFKHCHEEKKKVLNFMHKVHRVHTTIRNRKAIMIAWLIKNVLRLRFIYKDFIKMSIYMYIRSI